MTAINTFRRNFIKQAGALIVTVTVAGHSSLRAETGVKTGIGNWSRRVVTPESVDSWLVVHPDNTVTAYYGNVELGTGIRTALTQIVADELDVTFDSVKTVMGVTDVTPDQGITSASSSIRMGAQPLRAAAAEARSVLLKLGSEKLGMTVDKLITEDGFVKVVGENSKRVSYGELIGERQFERTISIEGSPDFFAMTATSKTPTKQPGDYKIVGNSVARVDIPGKVAADASYVQDLRFDGMLHARVLRPRTNVGCTLESIDLEAATKMPGVRKVVKNGSFVGVIAEREYAAIQAIEALRKTASWSMPELPEYDNLYESIIGIPAFTSDIAIEKGKPDLVPEDAEVTLDAQYRTPFQSHGSIGPSCAVAKYSDDQMTVWASTQGVYSFRRDVARILRMPEENIHVVYAEGAGCYGQNCQDDVAADAALLAQAFPGHPIRVQLMREDEFANETKYPAMVMNVRGAVSDDNNVSLLDMTVITGPHVARGGRDTSKTGLLSGLYIEDPLTPEAIPIGAFAWTHPSAPTEEPFYKIPNMRFKADYYAFPLRTAEMRAVGDFSNLFALESFMDELSVKAKQDPVAFRLNNMPADHRETDTLREVARIAKWKPRVSGSERTGRGRGVANGAHASGYISIITDVDMDTESGKAHVRKVYAAVDVGLVINPDGLKNQIEGAIIQGISRALKEQVTFDESGIVALDWASYSILTFPEVPSIEISIINRPALPPTGAGELGTAPMAAAVANAIYDATGVRSRELPLGRIDGKKKAA